MGISRDEDIIPELVEVLTASIDEFAETRQFTTGQVMGALFTLFVRSAQASPQYDPKRLVKEVSARIREAVSMQ